MLNTLYELAKPWLFRQDPESVHDRAIRLLATVSAHPKLLDQIPRPSIEPRLTVSLFGIDIQHPLGIAAGFDKNGVAFPALLKLGFGHVEIGTVTPREQEGNPRPRVFRLEEDRALINRMGFPGAGVSAVVSRAAQRMHEGMIVGCNIGPNKTSVESGTATSDLIAGYRATASMASWVTINVSSPNTEKLRDLQQKGTLREMLQALNDERSSLIWRPLLIKISPDLSDQELYDLIDVAIECKVDGLIATNTTVSRPAGLRSPHKSEAGGLSGAPLAPLAAATVRRIARYTGGSMPVIAAGGIETGADVIAAIEAGATMCQTYTGFIYRGPAMGHLVAQEILDELDRRGILSLSDLIASR